MSRHAGLPLRLPVCPHGDRHGGHCANGVGSADVQLAPWMDWAHDVSMHVVAIISRKGGAGKTTLSVNLAVASVLAGGPAVVLDMDPQGSAGGWAVPFIKRGVAGNDGIE